MSPTEPIEVSEKSFYKLLSAMAKTGFQGRKLGEAFEIWLEMLKEEGITILIGLSGAMVPAGMRKIIAWLIRNRYIDVLVSTGANLFHDIHEALGFRHYLGSEHTDDYKLFKRGIDRIHDVFAYEREFNKVDYTLASIISELDGVMSSRQFIEEIAKRIDVKDKNSIVISAYESGVPIFCPAIADSSIGIAAAIANRRVVIDTIKDVEELTEIVAGSEKTGVIYIGGGVPKNFIQQTEVVAIPGNHDARNIGIKYFEFYFGKTKKHLKLDDFIIIAADSTQPDLDEGFIGYEQREWIESKLRRDKTNILAIHHHVIPIPETGRERNVLIDAGEIIELLVSKGIAIVLAGHRHMPYSIKLMRTHIIHAGTLGSFKVLGMPDQNYNIIDLNNGSISLKLRFVDFGEVEIGSYKIKTEVPESVDMYHRIVKPKKVLFVSHDNACRTQIAEAIFNKIAPDNMLAYSVGISPVSRIDLKAIGVLREIGIYIGNKTTKKFNKEYAKEFDFIVAFEPDIEADEYWSVAKPSSMGECRKIRDVISKKVEKLVQKKILLM